MPLRTLAVYAQRIGKVFAWATTWSKLARQRGWRRPRRRVYPEKPKTGIRAKHPNEYWHIDVTVIRLVDDTKAFLHAVIDNFSRRILSWRLAERLDPTTTCEILKEAGKNLERDANRRRRLRCRKRERQGRPTHGRRSRAPCACPGGGQLQQFHDRSILAFSTPPVALPAFTRKLHAARAADRLLRQRAQHPHAPSRF